MNELELLLEILHGANLATPAIVGIISAIRGGRAQGKTDDEIKAESMQIALDTRALTEEDMSSNP
jgi:hypothetical protein